MANATKPTPPTTTVYAVRRPRILSVVLAETSFTKLALAFAMGCGTSRPALVMSGSSDGVCTIKGTKGQTISCDFAGATFPQKKDQDRFGLRFAGNGLSVGIFDGHSLGHQIKAGRDVAEDACRHMTDAVWARSKALLARMEGDAASPEVTKEMEAVFSTYQERRMARYKKDVLDALLLEKARLEKEAGLDEGDELPFEAPQDGGTTATVLVVHEGGVLATWVGDSRAVAGVQEDGGELRAEALTVDHSAEDEDELARITEAGGSTAAPKGSSVGADKLSKMVCVPGAEGTLAVTRSLGDSPHHKNNIVTHMPSVAHRPLTPSVKFVVACSDGVWDVLDNAAVVKLVGDHLKSFTGGAMQNAAKGACAAVVEEVKAKSPTVGVPDDDVSVVVVVFKIV